jgi:hypothetical protein
MIAMSVVGDVVFVSDEKDGVALAVQVGEEGHDFFTGLPRKT